MKKLDLLTLVSKEYGIVDLFLLVLRVLWI